MKRIVKHAKTTFSLILQISVKNATILVKHATEHRQMIVMTVLMDISKVTTFVANVIQTVSNALARETTARNARTDDILKKTSTFVLTVMQSVKHAKNRENVKRALMGTTETQIARNAILNAPLVILSAMVITKKCIVQHAHKDTIQRKLTIMMVL